MSIIFSMIYINRLFYYQRFISSRKMISTLNILRISLHQFIFFGKKRRKKMEHVNIIIIQLKMKKLILFYIFIQEKVRFIERKT
jgi:hypothetical protein